MFDIHPEGLARLKATFRRRATEARAAAHDAAGSAGEDAAAQFMDAFGPMPGTGVAVYFPHRTELDTRPLVTRLRAGGAVVALPVTGAKDGPLAFREWRADDPLVPGGYGVPVPNEGAREIRPDIVLTPLLAVRWDGARLGMGGGYYDRTLAALRRGGQVVAVGYGYAAQEMDRFPVAAHDQFLDAFVSETGVRRFAPRD